MSTNLNTTTMKAQGWNVDSASIAEVKNGGYVLMEGHGGEGVQAMQERLAALGYDLGKSGADGKFGHDTHDALVAFQKANGLTGKDADGMLGEKTYAKLFDEKAVRYRASDNVATTPVRKDEQKAIQNATQNPVPVKGDEKLKEEAKQARNQANASTMTPRRTPAAEPRIDRDYVFNKLGQATWNKYGQATQDAIVSAYQRSTPDQRKNLEALVRTDGFRQKGDAMLQQKILRTWAGNKDDASYPEYLSHLTGNEKFISRSPNTRMLVLDALGTRGDDVQYRKDIGKLVLNAPNDGVLELDLQQGGNVHRAVSVALINENEWEKRTVRGWIQSAQDALKPGEFE